jgi:mycothiol system anti-sigma-R factor
MNCNEAHQRLYRYLDGEMTPVRRAWVTLHLRRCPSCAGGFDFERQLKVRIANGCVDHMPQELHDRIVTFLRQTETDGLGA